MGAVLSQNGNPITFISKALNKTERNYATKKKYLLAIVCSLKNFMKLLIRSIRTRNPYGPPTNTKNTLGNK